MDDAALIAMETAVSELRNTTGGSDPWTEAQGSMRCSGGFAWRDRAGNQFDITISLARGVPATVAQQNAASLRQAWQTTMLGDDAACGTDPRGWDFARDCQARELQIFSGEKG